MILILVGGSFGTVGCQSIDSNTKSTDTSIPGNSVRAPSQSPPLSDESDPDQINHVTTDYADLQVELATYFYDRDEYALALHHYLSAIEKGNTDGIVSYRLAYCSEQLFGLTSSVRLAFQNAHDRLIEQYPGHRYIESSEARIVFDSTVQTPAPKTPDIDEERIGNTGTWRLYLRRASLVRNDSVGNEWSWSVRVNGRTLSTGQFVALDRTETASIEISVTERDDGRSDYGSGRKTVRFADFNNDSEMVMQVTVRENGGRYTGNTASWSFRFGVQ
jgi:hypothetical protein